MLTLTSVANAGQCPDSLVAYWPLDGNATELTQELEADLIGNVEFVDGHVGQGARLDGNFSYIDVGPSEEIGMSGGTEMTVAAWVKREVPPFIPGTDGDSVVITARTNCNAGNYQLYDSIGGGGGINGVTYFSKWGPPTESGELFVPSSISLADQPGGLEQWTHIAVTYAETEVNFYLNGVLIETKSADDPASGWFGDWSPTINTETQNVQLGWDSCSSYFTGTMDEVVVFSETLDDQAVASIYGSGVRREAVCSLDPVDASECKNGGWSDFGFKNQGQCVRFVNTGKDDRG